MSLKEFLDKLKMLSDSFGLPQHTHDNIWQTKQKITSEKFSTIKPDLKLIEVFFWKFTNLDTTTFESSTPPPSTGSGSGVWWLQCTCSGTLPVVRLLAGRGQGQGSVSPAPGLPARSVRGALTGSVVDDEQTGRAGARSWECGRRYR